MLSIYLLPFSSLFYACFYNYSLFLSSLTFFPCGLIDFLVLYLDSILLIFYVSIAGFLVCDYCDYCHMYIDLYMNHAFGTDNHLSSKSIFLKKESSPCGTVETNLTSTHEEKCSILGLTQWVKNLALLWLWCQPVATAPI